MEFPPFQFHAFYQNQKVIFCYMIKKEAIQLPMRKIECNLHGNPIRYKCEYSQCKSPYLCHHYECLEEHFHDDGPLVAAKFNLTLWESKLQEVENVISDDTLKDKEHFLTRVVKYFTGSLKKIQEEARNFEQMKFKFHDYDEEALTPVFLNQVDGLLTMGSKLERKIDKLRSKIHEQDLSLEESSEIICYERREHENEVEIEKDLLPNANEREIEEDHPDSHPEQKHLEVNISNNNMGNQEESEGSDLFRLEKKKQVQYTDNVQLTEFLGNHVKGFSWAKTNVLFNNNSPLTTCEKFHEKLRDKSNLLFLFLGDSLIIGSCYEVPYPSVAERSKKDENSFIFIEDETLADKFALFQADPLGDSHISVSEKLLICQGNTPNNGDGLRTFQRNFDSLAYFLPSRSFRDSIEGREVNYNGVLKIKKFYILQLLFD